MKILFFTQYFWPENFRINELVERYDEKHNTILTSNPSYPNFKIFKNFNKKKDLFCKNLQIFRMPVFPRSSSNISIILNYITFMILSFFYGLNVLFKRKVDLIFIFCPSPILSAIPLILLNKFFKKKTWVLDLWPDTVVDLKMVKQIFNLYIKENCRFYI